MNKNQILRELEKYNFDKNDYIVISGAALVLLGVKDKTNDIDIAVSDKLYEELLKQYDCIFEKNVDKYDIWFINGIINFSNHYYNCIDYIDYEGYKVQALESVLKLKN